MASRIKLDYTNYIDYDIVDNRILRKNESGGGGGGGSLGMVSEIEEVKEENEGSRLSFEVLHNSSCGGQLESIKEEGTESSSLFSFTFSSVVDEIIHVGIVEKHEEASMDALQWALTNYVNPISNVVCLVYIFPRVNIFQALLRKMTMDETNLEEQKIYLAYEQFKKMQYLTKFRNVCADYEVKVDTVMVESNMEEKALVKLIPLSHIRKLVVGITKRSFIRSSKKGGGTAGFIMKGAPENCEVKIICEGKEVGNEIPGVDDHRHNQTESSSTTTATPDGFYHDLASFDDNSTNKRNNRLFCVSCFDP